MKTHGVLEVKLHNHCTKLCLVSMPKLFSKGIYCCAHPSQESGWNPRASSHTGRYLRYDGDKMTAGLAYDTAQLYVSSGISPSENDTITICLRRIDTILWRLRMMCLSVSRENIAKNEKTWRSLKCFTTYLMHTRARKKMLKLWNVLGKTSSSVTGDIIFIQARTKIWTSLYRPV
jgi:hypothetical protein